ncbi:MAG TPA: protein kinase [Anaerolineales bacterium]|nr:protein kinase [Anaerolineales bacterium]
MDQQPTWIGRTLSGRYRIDALLGQGGMSAVYKATDPNLKRVVAIKLIHSHLSTDPLFVQRFEGEASAVASLRHPNIVQVYDFNTDNGVYYMVLEFIAGETLQDRLKRLADAGRQLSIEDAVKFTANIADAAGYAHQRGMVHRDIKPANIMLDVQGQAILMDFGIVKILGGDSHTSTGAVVGTARYMSPELIRGEVADHRSDLYSLGVTLYEMLSGRPPFVADSAMTLMMMHLNDPIPNVRGFRQDIPAEMVRILERLLAKDRNDRYQSAAELSADLRKALTMTGQQTTVSPVEVQEAHTIASPMDANSTAVRKTGAQPVPVPVPIPTPVASEPVSRPPASRRSLLMIGAGLVAVACLAGGFVLGRALLQGIGSAPPVTDTAPAVTSTTAATEEPVAIVLASETPAPSATVAPTDTALPTLSPTPEGPYVVITDIQVEGASYLYIVDYEVFNLDDSMHVHMFFNTVPPEQAGSPASGPWKLTWNQYGDPPFTQYGIANRPEGATQMCALVARSNHSVLLGTGNCVDLPE